MGAYWPLLICLAATFYLVGLIWVIQLLQYPLFAHVGEANFLTYHAEHSRRIVIALSLPVLLVFGSAFWLLFVRPAGVPVWAVWLNLVLTFAFWIVTALIQVPRHAQLGSGFQADIVAVLVASNWLRTVLWTAQGFLLVWMTAAAFTTAGL